MYLAQNRLITHYFGDNFGRFTHGQIFARADIDGRAMQQIDKSIVARAMQDSQNTSAFAKPSMHKNSYIGRPLLIERQQIIWVKQQDQEEHYKSQKNVKAGRTADYLSAWSITLSESRTFRQLCAVKLHPPVIPTRLVLSHVFYIDSDLEQP
ncbi:MAG: hypothetical protein Q7T48_11695 [Cellvibrio sp.]|uniref:hypothetical protein n=1 Tax=Cellvibrio sp. TaxID=1965322 RepID=UPI00271B2B92|nr:hypothetical protein [Cellvibrio sp.]